MDLPQPQNPLTRAWHIAVMARLRYATWMGRHFSKDAKGRIVSHYGRTIIFYFFISCQHFLDLET